MGVMECSRWGCDGIMCRRYSHRHGYICRDCFEEMVDRGVTNVREFMRTPAANEDEKLPREWYEKIFSDGES